MSHFLQRLVARSRGEAPVLGPRRRSRFEPGGEAALAVPTTSPTALGDGASPLRVGSSAAENGTSPATDGSTAAARTSRTPPNVSAPGAKTSRLASNASPSAAKPTHEPEDGFTPGAKPTRGTHYASTAPAKTTLPSRDTFAPGAKTSWDEDNAKTAPGETPDPASNEPALAAETLPLTSSRVRSGVDVSKDVFRSSTPGVEGLRGASSGSAPGDPAPESTRNDPPPSARAPETTPSASLPDGVSLPQTPSPYSRASMVPEQSPIRVTIGRIEVRSTREERPAPRKAPAAQPRMTLDAYAKLRESRR